MAKFLRDIDMTGNNITGLPAEPSENNAAASKAYVDSKAAPVTKVNNKDGVVVLSASDIGATDTNNLTTETTDTVQSLLDALFTLANSGKTLIAGAIGSPATSGKTFAELAGYINTAKTEIRNFINNAEGTATSNNTLVELTDKIDQVRVFKSVTKLNRNAGSTYQIRLKTFNGARPTLNQLCVLPYVRINDAATESVRCEFNNGAGESFKQNDFIEFVNVGGNDVATIKRNYTVTPTTSGNVQTYTVNFSVFFDWVSPDFTASGLQYSALPQPQILEANDDISLLNVLDILSVVLSGSLNVNGIEVPVVVSMNGGTTWYRYDGTSWVTDTLNAATMTGMTTNTMNALRLQEWTALRTLNNESNTIRFAYLLFNPFFDVGNLLDKLTMNLVLSGSMVPITASNSTGGLTTAYDSSTGDLTFTFSATDSYRINYLDTVDT